MAASPQFARAFLKELQYKSTKRGWPDTVHRLALDYAASLTTGNGRPPSGLPVEVGNMVQIVFADTCARFSQAVNIRELPGAKQDWFEGRYNREMVRFRQRQAKKRDG